MKKLNESPKVTAVVAVAVLLVAGYLIFRSSGSGQASNPFDSKWMYDLADNRLVLVESNSASPSDAGGQTVDLPELGNVGSLFQVTILTCGNPRDVQEGMSLEEIEAVDAWISHYSLAHNPPPANSPFPIGGSYSVSLDPQSGQWIPESTDAAAEMKTAQIKRCDSGGFSKYVKAQ